ncbi:MarR family transcriptional regulator [Pseudarthrobacter sp. fls2-241-R2A-127]|uniref:MarR family winged helix-turn-helix transcriptional regulator n=1 Tax=Pseudarthrobacter sp. fls2-241-R2A-127 TaxID=3040303 RepID=UPI0025526420|nr:MarR family transcriptional regulator [Pseudarthrobacter sp. fls2-241-R2A-127]
MITADSPSQEPHTDFDGVIAEVEQQFSNVIVRSRNNIKTRALAIDPALQAQGYMVLTVLYQFGARQQGWLAQEMATDKAMMSRTISQLESLNLVTRDIDPNDGRAQLVSMTAEAHARFRANLAEVHQLLHDRLSTWDIDEVRRLVALLAKINESGF